MDQPTIRATVAARATAIARRRLALPLIAVLIAGATRAVAADPPVPAGPWIDLAGPDPHRVWKGLGSWIIAGAAEVDPEDPRRLVAGLGTGPVLINGERGRADHLVSRQVFGDVELEVEFMVPEGSNSGVYLMGRYEVQILDSHGEARPSTSDCGAIYQRWDPLRPEGPGYDGRAPDRNAAAMPGRWQAFRIVFRAPRFDGSGRVVACARFELIEHNGLVIHRDVPVSGPTRAAMFRDQQTTGPIMLQGEHGPVAYRRMRVRRLEPRPLPDESPPVAGAEPGVLAHLVELEETPSELAGLHASAAPDLVLKRPTIDWTGEEGFGGLGDRFATEVETWLVIRDAGWYDFRLTSDDGSKLTIGDRPVISHDGLHAATARTGGIALDAGWHRIGLRHFEATGEQALRLEWRPPGGEAYGVVPESVLRRPAGG